MTRSLPLGPGGSAAPDDTRAFGVKVFYKCKLNTTLLERRGAHSWLWLEYNAWNDKLFSGSEWIAANTPDCCTQLRQEYKYDFWLQAQLSLRCFLQLHAGHNIKGSSVPSNLWAFFFLYTPAIFYFILVWKVSKWMYYSLERRKLQLGPFKITRCFLNITRIFITPFQDILDAR